MMKLNNLNFADITQRLESQMLLPKLTEQIIQSMLDEDINIAQLAAQIAQEQAIVVRTLRVANSPFYGLSRQVDNLESAIIILGFRTIRNIAFGVSLTHAFKKTSTFNQHTFWQHAIAVGSAARHLARLKKQNTEMAFTAGLLHNIGKLALGSVFSEEYKAVMAYQETHDVPLLTAEKTILGLDHTEIGAHLTKTWNLPPSLIDVVAFCHHPSQTNAKTADYAEKADFAECADSARIPNTTTDIIHIARAIAPALHLAEKDPKHTAVPPLDDGAWRRLSFNPDDLSATFANIINDYTDLSLALLE